MKSVSAFWSIYCKTEHARDSNPLVAQGGSYGCG
jgi:hypothetical protein